MRMRLLVAGLSRWKKTSLAWLVALKSATGQETSDSRSVPCHTGRADRWGALEFAEWRLPRLFAADERVVFLREPILAFFVTAIGCFPWNPERKRFAGTMFAHRRGC